MKTIGLTGSIGMGKSTTAGFFREMGIPVFDADAIVHELYARNGAAVSAIGEHFPGTVEDGAVNREALSAVLRQNPEGFAALEAIVHPLVAARRAAFIEQAEADGQALIVFDIPLLFETGQEDAYDIILVVTADPEIQAQRVLARPGMTLEKFQSILARQMPDAEKRDRANFIIDTSHGLEPARKQALGIIEILKAQAKQTRQSPDA
jgi:dephospho-CoA kinase